MPDFKSLKDLEKHLQKAIDNSMQNEVEEAIIEQEQESIERVVYDAYDPKYYIRRGSHGGLIDKNNMFGKLNSGRSNAGNSELSIYNNTPPNPNYRHSTLSSRFIDGAVEYGKEYDFYNPGERPFTEDAIEQLEYNKKHEKALKQGLKRQGIDTEWGRKHRPFFYFSITIDRRI